MKKPTDAVHAASFTDLTREDGGMDGSRERGKIEKEEFNKENL